jgi:ATP-dependent Zn protease
VGAVLLIVVVTGLAVLGRHMMNLAAKEEREVNNEFSAIDPLRLRNIAAAHESGHCLVAWFSSYVKAVNSVDIVGDDVAGGKTDATFAIGTELSVDTGWDILAYSMAGMAGELVRHGRFRTGNAAGDIASSLDVAEQILRVHAFKLIQKRFPPKEIGPDFEEYLSGPISDEAVQMLNFAFIEAKRRIRERHATFVRLEQALLARESLDREALESLLGERFWRTG